MEERKKEVKIPMRNKYNLNICKFFKGGFEDSAIEFSKEFVSCKRLDALLENYNQKEINVIGDRLLQELPNELHEELLKKNAGQRPLASLFR